MLNTTPIDPAEFARHIARHAGGWSCSRGPSEDVAVSTRVRLARNLRAHPFRNRIQPSAALEVAAELRRAFDKHPFDGDTRWVEIGQTPPLVRFLLRERYLVSRDLAPVGSREEPAHELAGRAVVFGVDEDLSVMVNEEDHVRIQSLASGFDLVGTFERAQGVDRMLEGEVEYAYDGELGYLTGCPTNVGTGMRASVMLHLPALALVRGELEKAIRAAQRAGLAVRGIYGEGSRAVGDFFQISNQITLGRTEEQLLGDLGRLVPSIIEYERRVREKLSQGWRDELEVRLDSTLETVGSATSMESSKALTALSVLRLGQLVGMDVGLGQPDFSRLVIQVQRGHTQALGPASEQPEGDVPASLRDRWRAAFLRARFARS